MGFIVGAILYCGGSYIMCLPATMTSSTFWNLLFISVFAGLTISYKGAKNDNVAYVTTRAMLVGATFLTFYVVVCQTFMSSKAFNAPAYANRITVEEGSFEEDIPTVSDLKKIPLMDSDTAYMIGNRAIGELTDVVSQFRPAGYATIIDNGKVVKVAPLLYNSYWKWKSNKHNGVPGYVIVDPETGEAQYVKLETGMKYSPSAFFEQDVVRHARTNFPNKHFGNRIFQLDNAGTPYWTIMTETPQTLFSAKKPDGLIIMNAITGECEWYEISDIPEWIDLAIEGKDVIKLYNDYGRLQQGYWNSVLAQRGCTKATNDYGYIAIGNDICISSI